MKTKKTTIIAEA